MSRPIRLAAVMTHPVQYAAPWFRHIAREMPELDLTVLYATEPTPAQQGTGFGQPVAWDVPLTEGYRARVVRAARPGDDVGSGRFFGLDAPGIGRAIRESRPDVVLLPGWHSIALVRALLACAAAGIPVVYRGDTHLGAAPRGWRRAGWGIRTRWLLGRFAACLAVGNRAETYLRAFGVPPERIFASPHCVDNDRFAREAEVHRTPAARAAARGALGCGRDEFVVAFVGKLVPGKRPLDAVRAVAELGADARLLVVGAGPLESRVREEAARGGAALAWAGFTNQSALPRAYAAADCVVLPSDAETWGLVVNEALASGVPAVVSDGVGCGPDLIVPGATGEVFVRGDVAALAAALARVRERTRAGHDWGPACRRQVEAHSFARAAEGLAAACRAVTAAGGAARPAPTGDAADGGARRRGPRVVACCGDMVVVGGRERQTFEVLRALRERGAAVHAIVNRWENHRIVALARDAGAGWSTGHYATAFDRRTRDPRRWAAFAWDVACTSWGLLRDARRFRATHVLVPGFDTALRNAPALVLLRALGRPVILRVGNHPPPGRFYRVLWRAVLPRLVTRFVANSAFATERLLAAGVPPRRVVTIPNGVARRRVDPEADADVVRLVKARPTLLSVGQLAPFKGTHLVVEAALALLAEGRDVQAVIVGRRPRWPAALERYAAELEARVRSAGAAERIHWVGERDNVLEIMRHAYLFLAPILQEETFGNVVLEAASAGLPAVAFATGGVVELVEHGVTGYLCEAPTLASLLDGVHYFLDEPARRDKASAACVAAADAEGRRRAFGDRWWKLVTERPA